MRNNNKKSGKSSLITLALILIIIAIVNSPDTNKDETASQTNLELSTNATTISETSELVTEVQTETQPEITKDEIINTLHSMLEQNSVKSITYDEESDSYICSFSYDGLTSEALSLINGVGDKTAWDDMVNNIALSCEITQEKIQSIGSNSNVAFFILNDENAENVLISIKNGKVLLDVVNNIN